MSNDDNRLLRQAYMDDQLSVSETSAFEQDLDPAEKDGIAREKAFESAVMDKLQDAECPEELWAGLRHTLLSSSESSTSSHLRYSSLSRWVAAAAALFLAGFVTYRIATSSQSNVAGNSIQLQFQPDLNDFARSVDIPGDYEKVKGSLVANDMHVNLAVPDSQAYHNIELLGVRYYHLGPHPVAHLFFSCCGQPVTALITRKETGHLENRVELPSGQGKMYTIFNEIDNYQIYVVGPHSPSDILDLFS